MSQTRRVRLQWIGEGLRFRGAGSEPATPPLAVDGDNETAPGPMLLLLIAAASCTASDVVLVLGKMRVSLTRCEVDVTGTRRDEAPRRYVTVAFRYTLAGSGLDRTKAERAVALSLEKYCSVVHSLAPDIAVSYDLVLA